MDIVKALKKVKNDLLDFIIENLKNKSDVTHTHPEIDEEIDQLVMDINKLNGMFPTISENAATFVRVVDGVVDTKTILDVAKEGM